MNKLWESIPTRTLVLLLAAAFGWLLNDYLGTRTAIRGLAHDIGQIEGRVSGWDATDRTLFTNIERLDHRIDALN